MITLDIMGGSGLHSYNPGTVDSSANNEKCETSYIFYTISLTQGKYITLKSKWNIF